jgi:signal transduction histidine kinase
MGTCSTASATAESAVTILVVDDHHVGRYTKAHVLRDAGFRVSEAHTGKDALRAVVEDRPTLVVLDVKLPDIDGISVCRKIKGDPATAGIMVLQVSAYYTTVEDQVSGLDSGADGYLPGDLSGPLLVAAVRAVLRTSRAEEALRQREQRLQVLQDLDRSHAELRALTAALVTAQEDERRRIARELHDDFAQRLALLEIDIANLKASRPEIGGDLDTLSGQVSSLSHDIRNLSHGLHPSFLEDLGLEAALRGLCDEFEHSHSLGVRFEYKKGALPVAAAAATTLYRIAQEALRNVVKHAGDACVTMSLYEKDGHCCLAVEDDGRGFDPHSNRSGPALGLISMQERVMLLGGRMSIHSAEGQGTRIEIEIPCADA